MWFQFITGLILVVIGVLIIIFRVRVARAQARLIRAMGGRGAEQEAKYTTPGMMLIVGAGALWVGISCVVTAVNRMTAG
ncbi:hypothetical protein [Agromyces aureus]|uniref:Uncharacterized protein n=1 Tax=Agromyces aureus TaxID=453304 RepID=A0A191WCB5_9MICO|nr:hypothetical protein [Agromyces aureus]ANJ25882.1 hypothetical protein ATC03_03110 [Agromyces aureus]